MAIVRITPTEVPPPMTCADCNEQPGAYDVVIYSASVGQEDDGESEGEVVMIAVCLTCIANLAGQLGGAAFALASGSVKS